MSPSLQPEAVVFGERLRELRTKRGETVRSLAELIGTSFAYISDMERGVKVPSLTMLLRLAVALDCKVTDLVDVFNRRDLRKLIPKRK
jgi:transcriptional regulator with XRE-family HTH domain